MVRHLAKAATRDACYHADLAACGITCDHASCPACCLLNTAAHSIIGILFVGVCVCGERVCVMAGEGRVCVCQHDARQGGRMCVQPTTPGKLCMQVWRWAAADMLSTHAVNAHATQHQRRTHAVTAAAATQHTVAQPNNAVPGLPRATRQFRHHCNTLWHSCRVVASPQRVLSVFISESPSATRVGRVPGASQGA